MTKAIVYTRFSPRRNADESESCGVQLDFCQKYAVQHGWEIAEVFHDPDVSGADEFREKLWQSIEALKKDYVLLVYKRDRLARNVYLSEQINRAVLKKGAKIVAVTGDIEGDSAEVMMIRQVLAAIAEYERKMIASRTKHAMRWHQSQGHRMGSECPYGWRQDPSDPKMMVPNADERDAISKILKWNRDGGLSYSAITRKLNDDPELRALARHAVWNAKTVRKICLSAE